MTYIKYAALEGGIDAWATALEGLTKKEKGLKIEKLKKIRRRANTIRRNLHHTCRGFTPSMTQEDWIYVWERCMYISMGLEFHLEVLCHVLGDYDWEWKYVTGLDNIAIPKNLDKIVIL